jgi:hypothetical protein
MAQRRTRKHSIDVALSFAGEQRSYVQRVAERLTELGISHFYDLSDEVALWGKDLTEHLDEIYRVKARHAVLFISKDYVRKAWPTHERRSALARLLNEGEYVLPARFDDTPVPGLQPTIQYVDLRRLSPEQFADLIAQKLGRKVVPTVASSRKSRANPQESSSIDPTEMQERATALVPRQDRNFAGDTLVLAAASGPRQPILRPTQIEDPELADMLLQSAMLGGLRLFKLEEARHSIQGDGLLLQLSSGSIYLNEEGSMRVTQSALPSDRKRLDIPVILHEDIVERLERAIRYIAWILDSVDSTDRMPRAALVASLHGGSAIDWRTRAEHARSPQSGVVSANLWGKHGMVGLNPPDRERAELRSNARELAEDLATRLKRQRAG